MLKIRLILLIIIFLSLSYSSAQETNYFSDTISTLQITENSEESKDIIEISPSKIEEAKEDAWNRLSKIRTNNATGQLVAEYLYDHEGNRIKKTVYNPYNNGHNESTYYMNTRPADFIQVVNTNGTEINETYI